jgi:HEAT repeat protein
MIFFPLNTYLKSPEILQVVTDDRLSLFAQMEKKYEEKDTEYFVKLLEHPDYVVRTRATCILVDFGGEDKVPHIAKVLKNDENELVRHEAAFSLGQMCYSSSVPPLTDATLNDPSMFVRHEAAIALGVVGNKDAKNALEKALNDPDKPVVESAVVALSNIEFMEKLSKNEKFAKLTGG